MAFSRKIKENALVAAARRCCVCRHFKGLNLEVHHIIPRSEGGKDDQDNAIVLCFDCHANAGHYNPKHPKGARFSPDELRRHRDNLHDQVRSGSIALPESSDWVCCRYLVCKNFSVISEIVHGDFSRIPVSEPLLIENIVLEQMRQLIQVHGKDSRGSSVDGDMFNDVAAYRAKHPEAHISETSDYPHYPYFRAFRTPDDVEIREQVSPLDPVSGYLLDAGASPKDICLAVGYDELCGDTGFQELYKIRPLWATFLEVRNMYEAPGTLRALHGELGVAERPYQKFSNSGGETCSISLPSAPVLPGQSVLVPLGVLLGPLKRTPPSPISRHVSDLDTGQCQEVDRVGYSSLAADVGVIGPIIWPSSVLIEFHGTTLTHEIHQFDLSNLYTIDRYWELGSCPHLFFRCGNGNLSYGQEIFSEGPGVNHCHQLTVPQNVEGVILAELERETTYIVYMSVNGQQCVSDKELRHGDHIEVPAKANDEIQIVGWYCPKLLGRQDPLYQNQLICHFIENATAIHHRPNIG